MERPRLSIGSGSLSPDDFSSSEDSVSLQSPSPVPSPPPMFPPMTVESMVVNKGGTGILHGNLTTVNLVQYLMPGGEDLDPKTVQDLVTDAVKISSDINNKFYPSHSSCIKEPGYDGDFDAVQRRWCCLIGALISLSLVTLMTSAVFWLTSFRFSSSTNPPATTATPVEDTPGQIADLPGAPRMVNRAAWVAMPPTGPLDNNSLPVELIIVCHTATVDCQTTPDCILVVRYVQQFHVESRKWSDIAYNFLIGGDGCVYVGRGWDKMGAHTKGFNNGTLGVAFIGTYTQKLPNAEQVQAFNHLITLGVRVGKVAADYRLLSQCQLQSTAAPGLMLARNMTSWPHYDPSLPIRCT